MVIRAFPGSATRRMVRLPASRWFCFVTAEGIDVERAIPLAQGIAVRLEDLGEDGGPLEIVRTSWSGSDGYDIQTWMQPRAKHVLSEAEGLNVT